MKTLASAVSSMAVAAGLRARVARDAIHMKRIVASARTFRAAMLALAGVDGDEQTTYRETR